MKDFEEVLKATFAAQIFQATDVLSKIPIERLPPQVRLAAERSGLQSASTGRSLGWALRNLPTVRIVSRTRSGNLYELIP